MLYRFFVLIGNWLKFYLFIHSKVQVNKLKMYTNGEISKVECQGHEDSLQFYPTWVGGPCDKSSFSERQIPMIFVATFLVLLMCGAVCFAVIKLNRYKKSLKEWAWRDRVNRKLAVPSVDFWRMSNSHTFNPFGVVGYDLSSPPATPCAQSCAPPPSFHVAVPPPPPYVDCVVSVDSVNTV